jgi:hypothetical protein
MTTMEQIEKAAPNMTVRVMIENRDWDGIAGMWHATDSSHGLPTIKGEWRQTLVDEAAKDGVDLLALAEDEAL